LFRRISQRLEGTEEHAVCHGLEKTETLETKGLFDLAEL
jgi:hypothetical protein